MKDLYNYLLFEALSLAPTDAVACKQHFDNNICAVSRGKDKGKPQDLIPLDVFEYIFELWQTKFDGKGGNIPFRCDNKNAKLSRVYELYANDIIAFCKKVGISASLGNDSHGSYIELAGVKIQFGEGSLGKVRSEKGLEYEDTIVEEIIRFVQKIAGAHANGRVSDKVLKDIFSDDIMITHWFDCYKQGGLDEILSIYIKNPSVDLHDYVKKTGAGDTKRNSHGQLFDKDFNVNLDDIIDVLEDSGRIIADVTIDGAGIKKPQYISVKMKASQLSGVSYRYAMANNELFQKAVQAYETYYEVKDDKKMVPFNNFCTVLGIDPKSVFDQYRAIYSKGKVFDNGNIQLIDNYDKRRLGCLIQKLIGGNYWYAKPASILYIGAKDHKLLFNVTSAIVTDSGKGIIIHGDVDGLKCDIIFRTSGVGIWPYRLFPKISVPDLLDKIK